MLSPLVLLYDPFLLAAASFWISISKRLATAEADENITAVLADVEQRHLVTEVITQQLLAFYKDVIEEERPSTELADGSFLPCKVD